MDVESIVGGALASWILSKGKIGLMGIKAAYNWVKPAGLARAEPLSLSISEFSYVSGVPKIPERTVLSVIGEIHLANPNPHTAMTIISIRLEVAGKSPYFASEARLSERNSGWYLVPAGGGFCSVPNKKYLTLPITVPSLGGIVGWVGFCLIERNDLTLGEATTMRANLVAVQTDGFQLRTPFPRFEWNERLPA